MVDPQRFELWELGPEEVVTMVKAIDKTGIPSRASWNIDVDTPKSAIQSLLLVSSMIEDTTTSDSDLVALISYIDKKYLIRVYTTNPDKLSWTYLGPRSILAL